MRNSEGEGAEHVKRDRCAIVWETADSLPDGHNHDRPARARQGRLRCRRFTRRSAHAQSYFPAGHPKAAEREVSDHGGGGPRPQRPAVSHRGRTPDDFGLDSERRSRNAEGSIDGFSGKLVVAFNLTIRRMNRRDSGKRRAAVAAEAVAAYGPESEKLSKATTPASRADAC